MNLNPDDFINPHPVMETEGELRHIYVGSRDNCRVRITSSYYGDPDEGTPCQLRVEAWWYPVVKKTPCGVWIQLYYGKNKFILNGAGKRFAHATLNDALSSFYARKRRQIGLLKWQLEHAQEALAWVKKELA